VENAVSYVFESDVCLETSSLFQIWFIGGNDVGIQIYIMGNNGNAAILHGRRGPHIDLGVKLGEWFKFRVEYYYVDGRNCIKAYVNENLAYTAVYYGSSEGMVAETYVGEELYTSEVVNNGEKIIRSVTRVDFKAPSTTVGCVCLDNVSFYGSMQEYD